MSFIGTLIRGLSRIDPGNTFVVRTYPNKKLYLFHSRRRKRGSSSNRPNTNKRTGQESSSDESVSVFVAEVQSRQNCESSSSSSSTSSSDTIRAIPTMQSHETKLAHLHNELEHLERQVRKKKEEILSLRSRTAAGCPSPSSRHATVVSASSSSSSSAASTEPEPHRVATGVRTTTGPDGESRRYIIAETQHVSDDGREILERRPVEEEAKLATKFGPVRRVRFA